MTRAAHVINLSRALRAVSLSPQLHALLTLLAWVKSQSDTITIAGCSARLGCGYHALLDHISDRPARVKGGKGSPHLFTIDKTQVPRRIAISPEGEAVLARVESLIARYAADAETTAAP